MIHALDTIFRPLARFAIAKGFRFSDVAERLRRAYVHEAQRQAGPSASVSRLSVMTGLQRRDVARLLETPDNATPSRPDPLARLVAVWVSDFDGAPLPQHGPAPSFDALARSVRQDVHPRSMLDALVDAGTVDLQDGQTRLLRKAHVPLQGSDAQIDYLAKNVGDHLSVAVGNVLGQSPGFDLAVHYDGLSDAAVRDLELLWRARMTAVLQEVNAKAKAHQETETGPARFRGGGYFHVENEE